MCIQLWGCTIKSRIAIIQHAQIHAQIKFLRLITDAQWFITNQTLCLYYRMPSFKEIIHAGSKVRNKRWFSQPNTFSRAPHHKIKANWTIYLTQGIRTFITEKSHYVLSLIHISPNVCLIEVVWVARKILCLTHALAVHWYPQIVIVSTLFTSWGILTAEKSTFMLWYILRQNIY